jgi:hypothetical protein
MLLQFVIFNDRWMVDDLRRKSILKLLNSHGQCNVIEQVMRKNEMYFLESMCKKSKNKKKTMSTYCMLVAERPTRSFI